MNFSAFALEFWGIFEIWECFGRLAFSGVFEVCRRFLQKVCSYPTIDVMCLERPKNGLRMQMGAKIFVCYNRTTGINPHGFQKYAIEVMLQLL